MRQPELEAKCNPLGRMLVFLRWLLLKLNPWVVCLRNGESIGYPQLEVKRTQQELRASCFVATESQQCRD